MAGEVITLLKIMDLGVTANSVDLTPYLRSYEVEYSDMDASTERNAKGYTVRDFLRTIRTIRCTFKTSSQDAVNIIMNLMNQKEAYLAYLDTQSGEYSEEVADLIHAYPSTKRTNSVYSVSNGVLYQEFSMEFIEF